MNRNRREKMSLFGGVINITGITFFVMSIFAIIVGGYLIGKISIKGVSLGTAGVFIASIIYGILHSKQLADTMNFSGIDFSPDALKIIENCGLVLFVCSVGLIAGPSFFSNLKKNFKSYILLGVVIILSGGLTTVVCYFIGRNGEADTKQFVALLTGLLSGALTSTPAFSAAKATVAPEYESAVTVGYGISYIFGVIGVVLFVQLVPKILHANIDEEVRKITDVSAGQRRKDDRHYVEIDPFGIGAFAFVILTGIFLGAIHIPLTSKGLAGTSFSLTTTGGVLIAGLIWGHFGHLGPISLHVKNEVLKTFQEFGLILFLIGAGVSGGSKFIEYFKPIYFVYGLFMTMIPMIIGFIVAMKVVKLHLMNALGCITGGMTSTPALGTLIKVAKTEAVASAYAATYPIALITVVLVCQFLILLLH